ncbi:hypothetical protein Aperf_G00000082394 [Anoplocephala perfoliata]
MAEIEFFQDTILCPSVTKYPSFNDNETSKRLHSLLLRQFPESGQSAFVVRAPGRVNLIGEHIDYSGYAVLPMALEQSVFIAASRLADDSQGVVRIISENDALEKCVISVEEAETFAIDGPPSTLIWYHYVLCGYRGFCDLAKQRFPNWKPPSMCMFVGYGDDPSYLLMNAGLSSSSALVVAAAMAVMQASNTYIEPTKYPSFNDNETSKRLHSLLLRQFPESGQSAFVVRAPGRVNLIGEHIDYSGYAVLPMALEQSVFIAASRLADDSQGVVRIISENDALEKCVISVEEAETFAIDGPPSTLIWYHYVLCGFRGFCDLAKQRFPNWKPPSMCMLVGYGDDPSYLPMNAGLSSSSALVVAAAMAVMQASNTYIEPKLLADICADCERLIGTKGGGMDQAACLLADSSAMLIEFTKPLLTTTAVKIPKGGIFCVADSGARLNKAATPDFNTRVAQCREAAEILLNHLGDKGETNRESITLSDVQRAYGKSQPGQMLGADSPWAKTFLTGLAETIPARRAKHCYSEAQRVLDFKNLCEQAEAQSGDAGANDEILRKLGELMNASHESCRNLYDCSCPELDQLVDICRASGSYGSRLTGAGWGGCVISLVREDHIQDFMVAVARGYYNSTPEAVSQKLFFTTAGRAAGFIKYS